MRAERTEIDNRPSRRGNGQMRTSNMAKKDRVRRIRTLQRRDGNWCWICGKSFVTEPPNDPLALSLDHVIPRRKGGTDALTNLRLAHRVCNERRANPKLGRRRTKDDP